MTTTKISVVVHDLKLEQPYFDDVVAERKTFEVRRSDRAYRVGDMLLLREWCRSRQEYSGAECTCRIEYILDDAEAPGLLQPGALVIGIYLTEISASPTFAEIAL